MTTTAPRAFRQIPIGRFLCAPFEPRSYANLLFLTLAFPLGLAYFVFLVVGLALGFGLLIIWVGIPVLALVLAGTWLFVKLERQLAIHLLGAELPPMLPAVRNPKGDLGGRLRDFLANPVTWKGMGYLAVKFPLGVATFVVCVVLTALSLSLLLAPFFLAWAPEPLSLSVDGSLWIIDTPAEASLSSLVGLGLAVLAVNLFNVLALAWGKLAVALLGSPRFAAPAPQPATAG